MIPPFQKQPGGGAAGKESGIFCLRTHKKRCNVNDDVLYLRQVFMPDVPRPEVFFMF